MFCFGLKDAWSVCSISSLKYELQFFYLKQRIWFIHEIRNTSATCNTHVHAIFTLGKSNLAVWLKCIQQRVEYQMERTMVSHYIWAMHEFFFTLVCDKFCFVVFFWLLKATYDGSSFSINHTRIFLQFGYIMSCRKTAAFHLKAGW